MNYYKTTLTERNGPPYQSAKSSVSHRLMLNKAYLIQTFQVLNSFDLKSFVMHNKCKCNVHFERTSFLKIIYNSFLKQQIEDSKLMNNHIERAKMQDLSLFPLTPRIMMT